ncbi:MAG: ice-binding family protein [Patescibacteria group bacterium]
MKKFTKNLITTSLIVSLMFVVALTFGSRATLAAATAPGLGTASSFSILAHLSMSAAGAGTTVSGDLGLSSGLAGSKTGPWTVGGSEYFGPLSLAATANTDALGAFNNLAGQASNGVWASITPTPGVWTIAADQTFSGTLTLNGDYNDVWVFQIGNDMTFDGSVVLTGNAQPCNVFWQIGRDATIASGSTFVGTLIASRDVTLVSGATVDGRIISLTSSITTDGNTISGPTCVAAPAVASATPRNNSITIVKQFVNDNGGTASTSSLFLNGSPVTSGQSLAFAPGLYTITETSIPNYTATFSGDCSTSGVVNHSTHNDVCIITNNDIGAPAVVPVVPPLIDVVKVPSPLALPAGPGGVTYTYTLRNIGTVPVSDITMVGDTCGPITLTSGDANANGKLEVGETWVHHCSTTLTETHTNTVVATGWANGISATDVASATVVVGVPEVVPPLIHVTKVPNPLKLLAGGGMVTYTEQITNPGTVALSNVTLVDDKCSPMKYISGDINHDYKLDPTETFTYTCQTKLTKTTVNTAVASGEANGLTVRDLAVATVVVAEAVPVLPNTGLPTTPWNMAMIFGALVLVVTSTVLVLKKRTN